MDYVIINVERSAKMDNKKIFSMNLKKQLDKNNLTLTEFSRKIGFNEQPYLIGYIVKHILV